jgi:hypothetical protein
MKQVAGAAMRMKYQRKLKHWKFMFLVNHFIGLFNDALSCPVYTAPKCTATEE